MGHANPNVEDGCRGEGEEPMGSKLPFADKEKERERERERETMELIRVAGIRNISRYCRRKGTTQPVIST